MGRLLCNSAERVPSAERRAPIAKKRKRMSLRWLWRWCPCGDCARRRDAVTLPGGIHWIRFGDKVIYRARRSRRFAAIDDDYPTADDCANKFDNVANFGGWSDSVKPRAE